MASRVRPLTRLVARGDWGEVRAYVLENGDCPTIDFLNNDLVQMKCGHEVPQLTARDRCLEVFQQMAEDGEVARGRLASEAIGQAFRFEINNRQIRFPCFRDVNSWIITFGFFKRGAQHGRGKWRNEDEKKSKVYRDGYNARKMKPGPTK